jgi:hypothetical protein
MSASDFIEETTTSIAGTNGDGAVTLAQITSIPRFSSAWGTGRRNVRYVIESSAGGTYKFERGSGYVESNVLTRSRPEITWNGSTFGDNAPAALAFGSTPTSGDIKVRIAPAVADAAPAMPGVNTTLAGDTTWRDYPIGSQAPWVTSGSSGTITADTEYYALHKLEMGGVLTGLRIDVMTAVASGFKWGLYEVGRDGLPGPCIVIGNALDTSTTGTKTDTTVGTWSPGAGGVYLAPGWYYKGFISNGAIAIRGVAGSLNTYRTPLGRRNTYGDGLTVARTGGSYATGLSTGTPSAPTSILDHGATSLGNPWIGLKVTP